MLTPNLESEIIVGTYEDYVVGYQIEVTQKSATNNGKKRIKTSDNKTAQISNGTNIPKSAHMSMEQSFAVRSHSGSVRCLAGSSSGSLLFSAGHDEMTNLFSLKKRKLVQTSEGAVTCASFVEDSHLICGSGEGNVYIYECKTSGMILVKTLKGHKAAITSIDTHPSGKVLLTLSRDKTMRTWNLIKGRCAYVTHLGLEAHIVRWSKSGDDFTIAADKDIYLYNSLGSLKQRVSLDKRVNSIEFMTCNLFVVATDSGKLEFFNSTKEGCKFIMKFDAHESRIKSVMCLTTTEDRAEQAPDEESGDSDNKTICLASASSDGTVKLWSIHKQHDTIMEPVELARVDVGARLTCMISSVRNPS